MTAINVSYVKLRNWVYQVNVDNYGQSWSFETENTSMIDDIIEFNNNRNERELVYFSDFDELVEFFLNSNPKK